MHYNSKMRGMSPKKAAALVLLFGSVAAAQMFMAQPETLPASSTAKKIIDGDTFKLANGAKVRLLEINTPELDGAEKSIALKAKKELAKLIKGKTLRLVSGSKLKDKYGRFLAYVFVNKNGKEILVNAELAQKGYARARLYAKAEKHWQQIKDAENKAKKAKRGIWK